MDFLKYQQFQHEGKFTFEGLYISRDEMNIHNPDKFEQSEEIKQNSNEILISEEKTIIDITSSEEEEIDEDVNDIDE